MRTIEVCGFLVVVIVGGLMLCLPAYLLWDMIINGPPHGFVHPFFIFGGILLGFWLTLTRLLFREWQDGRDARQRLET
jgi:hypothetical protein